MFYPRLIAIGATVLLGACSSDNDSSSDKKTDSLPQLNGIKVSTTPLTKASAQQFTTHLKNGLFMRHYQYDTPAQPTNSSEGDLATVTATSSSTNVQEQGVDEADRIKYDGQYMYISANSAHSLTVAEQYHQFVRIMKRDESGNVNQVKEVISSTTDYQTQQLYLHDNTLAVLNHDIGWFSIEPLMATSSSIVAPAAQQFELSLMDVSIPEQTTVKAHYTIEGQLIDTRVIEDQLYIVSNFRPKFDGFVGTDNTEQSKLADYKAIQNQNIDKLLPTIKNNLSDQSNPLFNPADCYINEGATQNDGYDAIMTLTKISLTDPTVQSSICVNTYIDGLYASKQALYAYSTHYQEGTSNSVIHKFNLADNAINYSATGEVTGHFGWNNPNLRFSEKQSYLRVLTSDGNSMDGFDHRLFVLEQQGNKLAVISQLPNESQPSKIGKVNTKDIVDENVYAVRFVEDRAYVVTFKQTDPLYVIDLSNMQAPVIAGALEIPGYSSYLHPINDNLLLGIGQHVNDLSDGVPVITQGTQVSLFDISDIGNPQQLNVHKFDNAYSAVESNYHAFSILKVADGQYRFTLPIETWHSSNSDSSSGTWTRENALAAFELNTGEKQMNYMGSSVITYPDSDNVPYVWSGNDRAIIHQDDLYYVHGNYIWQSNWLTAAKNTGPH
ncbi:hypothetical protein HG263_07540 [Pseudoalteromonas sp. JBTF-M23]|uniref:Beta propeller domain-containing protein n=1 Tax=Pseudoalteromonas caenipelagi TaxID=2726988 RepID=A0A849VCV7_9GAMM|nr:beta-propeller domain-containing protein [Pseudoalteromonas caenipelagi]NOU50393.1 hypothetical protein [Pseudoalteromonas caenipelagi]